MTLWTHLRVRSGFEYLGILFAAWFALVSLGITLVSALALVWKFGVWAVR